jgi:hypothetical protein
LVDVSEPYLSDSSGQSVQISGSPQTASPETPFELSFDVLVDIVVDSKNYIDWELEYIKLEGPFVDSRYGFSSNFLVEILF